LHSHLLQVFEIQEKTYQVHLRHYPRFQCLRDHRRGTLRLCASIVSKHFLFD